MRLFPAQSRGLRRAVPFFGLLVMLPLGLSAGGVAQSVDLEFDELRAWAEDRAANARQDQIELRFGPLTDRLKSQGQLEESTRLLQMWMTVSGGTSAVAAQRLAGLLLEQERFADVVEVVSRHRSTSEGGALALELALASWELGQLEDAEREFLVAINAARSETGDLLPTYQWARFLAWSGRMTESWSVYESLLGGPLGRSADVVLGAARACTSSLQEGACDPQRALELAQRTVELLPENTGAHYSLVRALEATGAKDEARAVATSVRELMAADQERAWADGRSQALAAEAEMRLRVGGAESAYELLCGTMNLEQCLSTDGRGADEWMALARVFWAMDQRTAALSLLERLVATHPEEPAWRRLLFSWRREANRG